MKKLYLLLLVYFTLSCSTEDPICCTVIDNLIDIKLIDEKGQNLLDAENSFSFSTFDEINGEWKRSKNAAQVISREDGNYLRVYANLEDPENDISSLKLQFTPEEFAVIRTQISRKNSNLFVTRVWYNDILKWEQENRTERIIEVLVN